MSETYHRTLSEKDAELKNRFYNNVGAELRRKQKSWAWLAEETGLVKTSLHTSKSGDCRLRMPTVLRIAKVLERTPEELLYGNSGINVGYFDAEALRDVVDSENVDVDDTTSVVVGFLKHLSLVQARNVMEHVLSYFNTDIETCKGKTNNGGEK